MGMSELARSDPYGIKVGEGSGKGGKGAKPPGVPDLVGAAREQFNAGNIANHPNQSGPFGSSQWGLGPDGQWSQNVSLAPGLQQGANNLMGQIGSQGPIGTGDEARQQAIDSAYSQAASRLDPQWQQREAATRSQLVNQGLDPGSQAYDTSMGNLGRERNDAYTSAMANAINQGTAAGHLAFTDNLTAANNPYQQLGMLKGFTSQPGTPTTGAPDLASALASMYQGQLGQYGMQQAGKNSQMSGAASLAPLFLMGA
jgi:hypothetical protein